MGSYFFDRMRYSYDPEFIDDMEFVFHNSTDELWDLSSDFDRAINKGFHPDWLRTAQGTPSRENP